MKSEFEIPIRSPINGVSEILAPENLRSRLFGVRSWSVWGPREVRSGSVRGPFGVRSGSVRGPFGVRSGSVRGPFGVRSGSVWANFGPNFSDPKILKFQKFSICAAVAAAAGAL